MAYQEEFDGLCPDCHTIFLATKEEFHKPKIFYGLVVWEIYQDSHLGDIFPVFKPNSPLFHTLVAHHETVGHHLGHSSFVLFNDAFESVDTIKIAPDQDDLAQRYPDSCGVLDPHAGGGVIFWKEQTHAQEVDTH